VKVLLAGSGIFAIPSFERVCDKFDVIGVLTQVDRPKGRGYRLSPTPVASWAEGQGLKVWKLSSLKDFSPEGDLMLIIDCGFIIPRKIIEAYPLGVVALHPSLLPKYRGADPIRRAIISGETETGVTTFFVNEKIDAGDIILQKSTEIGERETYGELCNRLALIGADVVEETLVMVVEGRAPRIPQKDEEATYAPKLKKEDRFINWFLPAIQIDRLIRALAPEPGALTYFRGKLLKILEAEVLCERTGKPGEILDVSKEGVLVSTGNGALLIKKLQPESKKCMRVNEFLCGYKPLRGEILGP